MTSSYEDIYSRFLQKCTDYDFIELDEETVYDNMEGWLHAVASLPYVRVKFKTFSLNDEVLKMNWELKNSIDDNSDELFVIEVFAQGMIIQWLEPKVKSILNVKQFFGGKEEKFYSQANHLNELRSLLSDANISLRKLLRDHGYIINSYISEE
jgi:hypothetical protein